MAARKSEMIENATGNGQEYAPDVSSAPDDWEWESRTEAVPTLVVFDTVGDTFIGQYMGKEIVTKEQSKLDEDFERLIFRGRDGNRYAVNISYRLEAAIENVEVGTWCRLRYVADIPTNRKQNPMKDITLDIRR